MCSYEAAGFQRHVAAATAAHNTARLPSAVLSDFNQAAVMQIAGQKMEPLCAELQQLLPGSRSDAMSQQLPAKM